MNTAKTLPEQIMTRLLSLFCIVFVTSCAANTPTVRSEATLDSGRPMTDGLKAYDVEHYTLRNNILVEEKAIAGSASIRFRAIKDMDVLELDFDGMYAIDSIEADGGALEYRREPAKLYIALGDILPAGEGAEITIRYHGQPIEAERAPWDGGFVWSETPSGKPWIATAMQGEGCDIWWPCKDHPTGEPNGMDLYFTVPGELTATSNGVLVSVEDLADGRKTFHWRTRVPTNTYGVALNVAPYVLIESRYESTNGTLVPVQFWAIEDHEDEARDLFEREFAATIQFFERRVGPYPWGQEKLGVTETPHLGMEHQTINAYGNEFRRGTYGFDWLFHHELAHEWFGNVMTHATVSDMWLHEGFGAFMQPEYTREVLGEAAFHAAMYQSYLQISACNPIAPREELSADELYFDDPEGLGPAGDIYSKGSWLLHSLRYILGEERFWRAVRRLVYDTTTPEQLPPPISARLRTTDDFMRIASEEAGQDLAWFFEVYARRGPLPELAVTESAAGVVLEWQNVGETVFPMPLPVRVDGELRRVEFDGNRAVLSGTGIAEIQIDPYMQVLRKLSIVPTCEERRAEEADSPHH
jgi:aminopeptidase N